MQILDPYFIDASSWQSLTWYNSGGTRAKRVLQDDSGNIWYFKCSERKSARGNTPEKYYKYEFWSEVLAYRLGKSLGLDILRYDVALHNGELGCISPLMIDQDSEQLIEVGRYMTVLNPDFNPEDRKTHGEYSFEFLTETLEQFELDDYLELFLVTVIFDALIGNTDRHQENWAFISRSTFLTKILEVVEKESKQEGFDKAPWIIRKFFRYIFDKKKRLSDKSQHSNLSEHQVVKMAPIYDSGSSLGRELADERIINMLKNPDMIMQYIANGKSELHWEKKKISHFDIIGNLLSSSYLEQVVKAASFLHAFSEQNVRKLVLSIDSKVPEQYKSYCLPDERKEFIIKVLTLRAQKIKGLIGYNG